jgi:protein-disulfide isomerase
MSRKTKRNQPDPEQQAPAATRASRRNLLVGAAVASLFVILAWTLLNKSDPTQAVQSGAAAEGAALASAHSPTLGDASAKVRVVEFLDPACETCARFFPLVKKVMAENPGRIHLSVRLVAFHNGSDYVVRLLEASRKQDKYWQTLDALLSSQDQWAPNHTVQQEMVSRVIAGVGLDMAQLMTDMTSQEVAQHIQQDADDAIVMKVTATPEYFVNGRPLPSFGEQQLLDLLSEELQRAY